MFEGLGNRFIFPAPEPSYGATSYKRHLCWIPWNKVISPEKVNDEKWGDGIPCLWFPAPKAATVILFFHANAEDLGMSFAVLKHMRDQFKVNVLAVEYPGYGLLHGMMPSEQGVYEVALTTFRFLVDEIGVRYSQIILFGRSLGSGPAVYLAAQYPVGGLILVSPFSSIRAAVTSIVGRVFAWTFQERFPNVKIIANVSCSTLFIHGESDGLIPAEHSLRLFRRCRARKLLITPPRMEHNSNLFGDASFLAVPAIHFFGFPGYYTTTPPRLPACLFESPRQRPPDQAPQGTLMKPWLCDCLAKSDAHHLDVNVCRTENSVEDITIRFFPNGGPDGTATRPDAPGEPDAAAAPQSPQDGAHRPRGAADGAPRASQETAPPRPPAADDGAELETTSLNGQMASPSSDDAVLPDGGDTVPPVGDASPTAAAEVPGESGSLSAAQQKRSPPPSPPPEPQTTAAPEDSATADADAASAEAAPAAVSDATNAAAAAPATGAAGEAPSAPAPGSRSPSEQRGRMLGRSPRSARGRSMEPHGALRSEAPGGRGASSRGYSAPPSRAAFGSGSSEASEGVADLII